jgi:hypothetical protein
MAIQVRCECGRTLAVPEAAAGKRVKCSTCGAILDVPTALEPIEEHVGPARRAAGTREVRGRGRRYTPRRGAPAPLIAGAVFLVLAIVIVGLFVALRPHQPFIPRPGEMFLRSFQLALNANDADTVRNMMTRRFNESIREGIERSSDETFVAAWMRANQQRLRELSAASYVSEEAAGSPDRLRVACTTTGGTTIRLFIDFQGNQWLFDGME